MSFERAKEHLRKEGFEERIIIPGKSSTRQFTLLPEQITVQYVFQFPILRNAADIKNG